jgi:hypothetical protein
MLLVVKTMLLVVKPHFGEKDHTHQHPILGKKTTHTSTSKPSLGKNNPLIGKLVMNCLGSNCLVTSMVSTYASHSKRIRASSCSCKQLHCRKRRSLVLQSELQTYEACTAASDLIVRPQDLVVPGRSNWRSILGYLAINCSVVQLQSSFQPF